MRSGDRKTGHKAAGAAREDKLKQTEAGPWRPEMLRKERNSGSGRLTQEDTSGARHSGSKGPLDGKAAWSLPGWESRHTGPCFFCEQRCE